MGGNPISIGDAVWRIGGDLGPLNDALGKSRQAIEGAYGSIMASAQRVGVGMTAVGGAMAAGLGVAVKAASEFQSGLATLATLGVKDLEAAGDAVKNVVALTGTDLADAFKGAYDAVSAGVPEDNLFKFLEDSATASVAGLTDFATTINYAKTMANVFGTEVGDAMDQAFVAVKLGVTTFGELADSVGRLAPTWKAAGLGSDEMLGALAAVTKQGIVTTEAVTSLKAAMTSIIKPAGDAAGIVGTLGVEFDAAALKAKGWGGFLKDLISDLNKGQAAALKNKDAVAAMIAELEAAAGGTEKYKGQLGKLRAEHETLTEATDEQIAVLAKLFGSVEALNAVLALTSEQGAKDFNNIMQAMNERAGATLEAFRAMVKDNPAMAWRILRGELTVMAVEIGQKLTPALYSLALILKEVVLAVSGWIDRHPLLTDIIVKGVAAVAAFNLTLGPLLIIIPRLIIGLGQMQLTFGLLNGSILATGAAATATTTAMGAVGAAVGGFGIAAGAAAVAVAAFEIALGVVAATIGIAVVGAFIKLGQAIWQMGQTHWAAVDAERAYEQQLQSMGVAIDAATQKQEGSNERLQALNAARIAHREDTFKRELELLTGYEVTAQEFHNAELARVGAELSSAQAAMLVKARLTQDEIQVLLNLDDARQQSFANYVQMLIDTKASVGDAARGIRNELVRLSLDTRQSPSINDLVRASTRNTVSIYQDMAAALVDVVSGLQQTLSRLWAAIMGGAGAAWQGLTGMLGGMGIGAYAAGGNVRGWNRYATILAGEEGPEFATFPGGKRVLLGAYGPRFYRVPTGTYIHDFQRTLRMLMGGAPYAGAYARGGYVPAAAGGVTVNVSIPSVSVREEVDVRRISEEIAARVSRAVMRAGR